VKTPEVLKDNALSANWKDAKDNAIKAAKKTPYEARLDSLIKSFNKSLRKELENWVDAFPDFEKMTRRSDAATATAKLYLKKIQDEERQKPEAKYKAILQSLSKILSDLPGELKQRTALALEEISEEKQLKLAIEKSKETAELSKKLRPIIVFNIPDASAVIQKRAGVKNPPIELNKVALALVIGDAKVLEKIDPDNSNALQKIKDAANVSDIVIQLAEVFSKLCKGIDEGKLSAEQAQSAFNKKLSEEIDEARQRVANKVNAICAIKSTYRMYQVKSAVKLGAAVGGAAKDAATVATGVIAPPNMIVGMIKLCFAIRDICNQISALTDSAQEHLNSLHKDIGTLEARFKSMKPGDMAKLNLASVAANSFFKSEITTLEGCREKLSTCKNKIKGLSVKADSKSEKITELLDMQEKAVQKLSAALAKAKGGDAKSVNLHFPSN